MERKIKLIWDFKGIDSKKTAEHHKIHLDEFIGKENIDLAISGIEFANEMNSLAYLVVMESDVFSVRDALIPHRAEIME